MRCSSIFTVAASFFLALSLVSAQASNDDPTGKKLYVNSPACGYYQCKVTWNHGERVTVNWLNSPSGDVSIRLLPETDDSLPSYTIVKSISGTHASKSCDKAGTNESCGRYKWTVPNDVKPGEYTVKVHSLDHIKYSGYTDTVVISDKSSKRRLDEDEFEEEEEDEA